MDRALNSDKDSTLNKFLREHDGKPGVVVLDEADKLSIEAWEGLYRLFDEGIFQARVNSVSNSEESKSSRELSREVDCRKIIWVLTTNMLDSYILTFEKANRARIDQALAKVVRGEFDNDADDLLDDINHYLSPKFRSFFPEVNGAAIDSRINIKVPFFAFNSEETVVLTESMLNELAVLLREPPSDKQIIGKSCTRPK